MAEKNRGRRKMARHGKLGGKAIKGCTMDDMSLSPQKELAELLKARFPLVFAEGKVDPDSLNHEGTKSTKVFDTDLHRIDTVFARLGVLDEPCLLSELSRSIRLHSPCGQKKGPTFSSQAKDTDLIGRAFKNNDHLKTNLALQMEKKKIEFKMI